MELHTQSPCFYFSNLPACTFVHTKCPFKTSCILRTPYKSTYCLPAGRPHQLVSFIYSAPSGCPACVSLPRTPPAVWLAASGRLFWPPVKDPAERERRNVMIQSFLAECHAFTTTREKMKTSLRQEEMKRRRANMWRGSVFERWIWWVAKQEQSH